MKIVILTENLPSKVDEKGNIVTEEFTLPKINSIINDTYTLREISYSVQDNKVVLIKVCTPIERREPRDTGKMEIIKTYDLTKK